MEKDGGKRRRSHCGDFVFHAKEFGWPVGRHHWKKCSKRLACSDLNTVKITMAAHTWIWDSSKSHLGNIEDLALVVVMTLERTNLVSEGG